MISFKDYAAEKGITYEAVRSQVSRYKEELEGQIVKEGRTQYLTDAAVAFLDEHRNKEPIVVTEAVSARKIKELEATLEAERKEKDDINRLLRDQFQKVQSLQDDKMRLTEKAASVERMELEIKTAADEAKRLSKEIEDLRLQLMAEQQRRLTWRERFFGRKGE